MRNHNGPSDRNHLLQCPVSAYKTVQVLGDPPLHVRRLVAGTARAFMFSYRSALSADLTAPHVLGADQKQKDTAPVNAHANTCVIHRNCWQLRSRTEPKPSDSYNTPNMCVVRYCILKSTCH